MKLADHAKTLGSSIPDLALVLIGVIATFVLLSMPILVAGMVANLQLGDQEIGWLAASDMAGGALACALFLPRVSRVNWRVPVRLGIVFAIVGNLVSIFANGFESLMVIRVLTGFANGFVLAVVFTGLCHSNNPDRFFGAYVFAQLTLQVILLAVFPRVMSVYGMAGIFIILAAASALSLFFVSRIPQDLTRQQERSQSATVENPRDTDQGKHTLGTWAIVALAAQALYFLAPAAIWGYLEPIGGTFLLDIKEVGDALSLASFAGIAGAAAVVILGSRYDRIHSMSVGVLISLAAVFVWLFGGGYSSYLIAAAIFSFAWNFTFPYQMGVLALFDRVGAVAVLSLIVQLSGLAFGPLLASLLLRGEGFDTILWACVICYIGSLVLFVAANRNRPTGGVQNAD